MEARIIIAVLAILCFKFSDAQVPQFLPSGGIFQPLTNVPTISVPSFPPSIIDIFTTEVIRGINLYDSIDRIFSTNLNPAEAYVIAFNLIYSKGRKHGVEPERALAGAKPVGQAIDDVIALITVEQFAVANINVVADMLVYGNVINYTNAIPLAQECCKTFLDVFSKDLPNNIQGISDGVEQFLDPYQLYAPDAFEVKNSNIVKNYYAAAGLEPPLS